MKSLVVKFTLVLVLLALLVLIVRGDVVSFSPLVIAGQLIGVLLVVSARVAFRKQQFLAVATPGDGPLVRRGPYRWLRHPMYAGALLLIWVSILGHWSPLNGAIGAAVILFVVIRIEVEEQLLRSRYPEYGEYSKNTKRIIPLIY